MCRALRASPTAPGSASGSRSVDTTTDWLADCPFLFPLEPADDRVEDLCLPASSRTISCDRIANHFRSCTQVVASAGVTELAASGDGLRPLMNAQLLRAVVNAIERGPHSRECLDTAFVRALPEVRAGHGRTSAERPGAAYRQRRCRHRCRAAPGVTRARQCKRPWHGANKVPRPARSSARRAAG